MPFAQAMVERVNVAYNRDNISNLPDGSLDGLSFVDAAKQLGLAKTDAELNYLERLPASIQEGLRAALRAARLNRLPLQMVWTPAADFELNVWQVPGIAESIGGISVVLRGPYAKASST